MSEFWERFLVAVAVIVDRGGRREARRPPDPPAQASRPAAATRYRILRRVDLRRDRLRRRALGAARDPAGARVAGAILASSAVLGLVLGFAAQRTIGNFIAGLLIAFTQPVRLGDEVEFAGARRRRRGDRAHLHVGPNPRQRPARDPEREARVRDAPQLDHPQPADARRGHGARAAHGRPARASSRRSSATSTRPTSPSSPGDATIAVRRGVPDQRLADRAASDLRLTRARRAPRDRGAPADASPFGRPRPPPRAPRSTRTRGATASKRTAGAQAPSPRRVVRRCSPPRSLAPVARRRRRVLGELRPLEPAPGQDRPELVRLRGRRHPARLDPGRAEPRAGPARPDQRRGSRRRRSRSRTGASTSTAASTTRASRARSGGRQRRQGRRGRLDDRPAARPQPLHRPRADVRAEAQGGVPRDQAQPSSGRSSGSSTSTSTPSTTATTPTASRRRRRRTSPGTRAQLTLAQAALLAGLPQAPSIYDPLHNPKAALARRNEVLRGDARRPARSRRRSTAGDAASTLVLKPGRIYTRIQQPYFFSYVIDELERVYGANTVREGGLRVYTTIEPRLQRAANKAIRDVSTTGRPGRGDRLGRARHRRDPRDDRRHPRQHEEPVQPRRAVGAAGGLDVQDVRARRRDREGHRPRLDLLHLGAVHVHDAARGASDYGRKPWQVTTYDHSYAGSISVTRATLRSDNTVYAQLTLDVGPDYVWRMAKRLGVHLTQKPVASIGLGLARGLAARHGGGVRDVRRGRDLREADRDHEGRPPERQGRHDCGLGQAADEARALAGRRVEGQPRCSAQNAQYGTGAGSGDGIHPNAGKTGTTEDHADAWFDGYTRDFSTVVWMGYPTGEIPMLSVHGQAVAGATFPVPIWHHYMAAALWHHKVLGRSTSRTSYPIVALRSRMGATAASAITRRTRTRRRTPSRTPPARRRQPRLRHPQ